MFGFLVINVSMAADVSGLLNRTDRCMCELRVFVVLGCLWLLLWLLLLLAPRSYLLRTQKLTPPPPPPPPPAPFGCEPSVVDCRSLLLGVGQTVYSITCFACCQKSLYRTNFYLPVSFNSAPSCSFLSFVGRFVCLFVLFFANAVSRADVPNKVGHAAHRHKPVMQVPVLRQ